MINDWNRPDGDDTSRWTNYVNLFNTDPEELLRHYIEVYSINDLKKQP
jgi:hypothetical protein